VGHPLEACHARLGRKTASATAAPSHGQRSAGGGARASPGSRRRDRARKNSIECFVNRPRPMTAPSATQAAGRRPRRCGRGGTTPRATAAARTPGCRTGSRFAGRPARRASPGRRAAGETTPAQPAGQEPCEEHRRGPGERREDPQPDERLPREGRGQTGDPRHQRWMIDVAPGEVPAAREEVQLVVVVAVARQDRQVEQDLGQGATERHERCAASGWSRGSRVAGHATAGGTQAGPRGFHARGGPSKASAVQPWRRLASRNGT